MGWGLRSARLGLAAIAGVLALAAVGSASTGRVATSATLTVGVNGPDAVRQGDELLFTVNVYDTPTADASNVVVTMPVPAGTVFESAVQEAPSGAQPTFACTTPAVGAGGTISCTAATLPNGVGVTFDIDVHVPVGTANGTTIHTTATAQGTNAASTSGALDTYVGGADLYTQVSGRNHAPDGARLAYTVMVMNGGPENAAGASLVVWVPSHTTLVSFTPEDPAFTCVQSTTDGLHVTCTAGSFAASTEAQFDVVLLVDQHVSGSIAVSPRVSATTPDPDSTNNNASQPTSLYAAGAPSAHTDNASSITTTAATLHCSIEYDDIPTTYVFQYGATTAYGSTTAAAVADVSHPTTLVTGLTPATTYHYRVVATNFAGSSVGMDQTFTTLAQDPTLAPSVTTGAVSGLSTTGATLAGTVNPKGAATTYEFEYGTTTAYGGSTGDTDAGAGNAAVTVSETLSALSPATTYHYRLVATNVQGTTYGSDATFTTATPTPVVPTVETWSATDVAATAANIAGTFNPNGFSTTYWFEYGTTNAYGSTYTLPDTAVSGWDTVTVRLDDLQPSTTYHYRLVASNAAGTVYGGDLAFTTAAAPAAGTSGETSGETPPLTVTEQAGATTAASIAAGRSGSLTLTGLLDTPAPSMSWSAGTFPSGAVVTAETFSATPGSTPPVLNGFAVGSLGVEVDFRSGGSELHTFAAPLEIVFPNASPGLVPSYTNDEGLTWIAIPLLSGTTLPAGQQDGYFRDAAGAVHILTRHATYFGLIGDLVLLRGNRPTFPVGSKRIFVYLAPERPAQAIVTLATRRGAPLRTLHLNLPATTTRLKIPLPHGLRAGLYLVQVTATSGPASGNATLLVRLVATRHR